MWCAGELKLPENRVYQCAKVQELQKRKEGVKKKEYAGRGGRKGQKAYVNNT